MELVRNSRANFNRKFRDMSGSAYHDAACGYLQEKWGPLRNAPKLLARISGATPRAALNWLTGQNPPGPDAMITLMARDPGFKRMILELEAERAFDARMAAHELEVQEIRRLLDECL